MLTKNSIIRGVGSSNGLAFSWLPDVAGAHESEAIGARVIINGQLLYVTLNKKSQLTKLCFLIVVRNDLMTFFSGAINVHPSLLPKLRGSSPIVHTLLNGDTETGVSIIEVSPKK